MTDDVPLTTHGEAVLRVVPEPADINANGHIFGGWVLAMMDRAGGIIAGRVAQGRCATVAIESMEFLAPIHLGDLISIYGHVERRGRTSMAIRLNVVAERHRGTTRVDVTTGLFTFVALDEDFRPTPLPVD
jgi:acyl-CoA thioesterase YciA